MSGKERDRMGIMAGVKAKELSQVQAAELMGLGYRQAKRIWWRYQKEGDAGLVHRLRGQAGLLCQPAGVRAQVLRLCAQEQYQDFGLTSLAEELAKVGVVVDHDTVRRWLLAAGGRTVRRRRQQHRQWRERKPCFGTMVQLDGSHHDWFEGRRAKCVLMVMVDDATNRIAVRFFGRRQPGPATISSSAGCARTACPAACMWIGTASADAREKRAWRTNGRVRNGERSLGARWHSWGWISF